MITIVGLVADTLGAASQYVTVPQRRAGRTFDVRREFFSLRSTEYRFEQPSEIVVDLNHEQPIGSVKYLEATARGLFAVSEIDGSNLGEGPWFYSPAVSHCAGREIELLGLAVTRSPASCGLGPLTAFPGTLADAASKIVYQDGWEAQFVRRAHDYDCHRTRGESLAVQVTRPLDNNEREGMDSVHALAARYQPQGRTDTGSYGAQDPRSYVGAIIEQSRHHGRVLSVE
jgi:hypothetical protein